MNILYARESEDDDSAVGSMGDFVALQSFGSEASGDDESTVQTQTAEIRQKKRAEIKRNMLPIVGTPGKYKDIEATQSTDSAVYNDGSCGVCVSQLFGWNPQSVVVKVAAIARPHRTNGKSGICEPMPLPGMPKLILVGTVMTKTPEGCPLAFNDRILGIFDEEMYYSETYTNLPFKNLIRLKKNLEPWQQISILLSYLPALHILQSCPFTVEDNRVLLNAGLGPINQALIHLCKLHRAKRIYVPVESEYASLVREIGAKPVGPKHSDWGPILLDTVDIVIDSIGANGFVTSKAMLVETGHMVVTGCKEMDSKKDDWFYSMNKRYVDWRLNSSSRTTIFQFMKVFENDRELFEKDFKYLDKLVWDEVLPVINTSVTPDQCADGSRDSDALDGYDIVQIPEVEGWA
mmetsp:Transcript_14348/g.21558  ORF Transcript_14348/g.21558 Transcript_14348/m.21558 type:complete len:405 (+) Transcript_14348:100-1314(+)